MTRSRAIVLSLLLAACAQREEPPRTDQTPGEHRPVDQARVQELERRARALATTNGCDRAEQCASAPVGAKACGGPRSYLVYCKATTDEAALLRALEELKRAEESYNREAGVVSDCALAAPPEIRLEGRACTAAAP